MLFFIGFSKEMGIYRFGITGSCLNQRGINLSISSGSI